jgi:AcrR family transcriptional regulator
MDKGGVNVRKSEGAAMAKRADRRVQRTQQLLEQALLSLIKEKAFDAISVQEIIDRANVGRATFYEHYDNKEDLLDSGFHGLEARLKERQREARSRGCNLDEQLFAFSHELLGHAYEHRDVFPAMVGKRGGAVIQHVLRKLLVALVREDVKATASEGGAGAVPPEAIVQFLANGLFGLLVWWLNGRMRLSVEEVNGIFRRLALPAVKAALR